MRLLLAGRKDMFSEETFEMSSAKYVSVKIIQKYQNKLFL